MLIPVRCFTCNTILGNKYIKYKECVEKQKLINFLRYVAAEYGIDISKKEADLNLDSDVKVLEKIYWDTKKKLSDSDKETMAQDELFSFLDQKINDHNGETPEYSVLNYLGLPRYCCRATMLSQVELIDII